MSVESSNGVLLIYGPSTINLYDELILDQLSPFLISVLVTHSHSKLQQDLSQEE